MRRTAAVLLAVTALLAGCGQPAEAPEPASASKAAAPAPPPVMPADAPPQEEVLVDAGTDSSPAPCADSLGAEAAGRLVERCRAVSPATHPPCNVANPCEMIQGEIDRACELYAPGETRPAECGA